MINVGVILFTNDLRVEDNATLLSACAQVDKLICLYCVESFRTSLAAHTPECHQSSGRVFSMNPLPP